MPRPVTVENPVIGAGPVKTFREKYEEKKKVVDERKDAYDEAKTDLNDFRNTFAEETSLCVPPVEFFMKKARENSPKVCILWLRAAVITFKEMGVFDQGDMFLIDELTKEIQSAKAEAAA